MKEKREREKGGGGGGRRGGRLQGKEREEKRRGRGAEEMSLTITKYNNSPSIFHWPRSQGTHHPLLVPAHNHTDRHPHSNKEVGGTSMLPSLLQIFGWKPAAPETSTFPCTSSLHTRNACKTHFIQLHSEKLNQVTRSDGYKKKSLIFFCGKTTPFRRSQFYTNLAIDSHPSGTLYRQSSK